MFKYTKSKYAKLLLEDNIVRVGTLYGFRDMEAKPGISDPLEGSYLNKIKIDTLDTAKTPITPQLRSNLSGIMSITDSLPFPCTIRGFTHVKAYTSPNCLIFCVSNQKSKKTMQQFKDADTCIEIYDPDKFFTLLNRSVLKKLKNKVKWRGAFDVRYGNYERMQANPYHKPLHPAIVKTKDFSEQHEMRALWLPKAPITLQPFYDLKVPGMKSCCRLIEIDH